jgi:hypothetical protein
LLACLYLGCSLQHAFQCHRVLAKVFKLLKYSFLELERQLLVEGGGSVSLGSLNTSTAGAAAAAAVRGGQVCNSHITIRQWCSFLKVHSCIQSHHRFKLQAANCRSLHT